MMGIVVRTLASLAISLMMVYVPREKYQKELDELPTMAQRAARSEVAGWHFETVTSERTGITHGYYSFPSAKPDVPTLLCLHGFNTDGRVFTNLEPLADRCHLIALNFPEESYLYNGALRDFTVIIDDFLETLALDTISLLGNSVGGGIAIAYTATTNRSTIRELILVSTSVFGASEADRRRMRGMADKLLKYPDYKLYYLLKRGKAILDRIQKTELGESVPSDLVVTKRIGWYRQILTALYGYDGRTHASRIGCPVLVIHGTEDRILPVESAKVASEIIPRASFVPLEGAAHSLAYTNADELVGHIRAFRRGHGGATRSLR